MKKIKLVLLLFLMTVFCTMNIDCVHAEEGKDILKSITHYTQTSDYELGDKITFNVEEKEEITSLIITFYNSTSLDGHNYGMFTVQLNPDSSYDGRMRSFSGNIPKTATTDNSHNGLIIYPGTYEITTIFAYDKNNNLTRYTLDEEYAKESGFLFISAGTTINLKGELKKDGPDILKSVVLNTNNNNFYIGDKIQFNVETAEEISSIAVNFNNSTSYSMFTAFLSPDGPYNGSIRSYSGYIPKTIAGYYATSETGRTELTIQPGTYEINSIFLYDKNGKYIRYTTQKEYADTSEFLYYQPKIVINLEEPTAEELNDVNFILEQLSLKNQSAGIGEKVALDINYSYNDTYKKIKSIYLIFRDSSKKQTFTTYVKSLFNNPYFIVASSADLKTYKLDSIGVTFEAKDGTNNTIIINSSTNSGKYSEIFNQDITITKEKSPEDSKLYFSADELNDEVYKKIEDSKDNSIVIDADNYTIIPLQLFDTIKRSKKNLTIKHNGIEWVFNGEDIKTPKDIDILIKFYEMNDSNISTSLRKEIKDEAIILEFPDNGELPGNVLIRIKDPEVIDKLTGDKYYVYYIDTENDKLNKVALEIKKSTEGYIEFYINHNSKYLISSKEITNQTVLGEDEPLLEKNTELNEKSSINNRKPVVLYSLIAIAFIIVILISVFRITKEKNKKIDNKKND